MNWLSWTWFAPARLKSFDWDNILWIYGIGVILVLMLLRWLFVYRFRQRLPIALTNKDLRSDPISILRLVPSLLFSIATALILVALARPQSTNEQIDQWSEGIDIMLTIDISESMKIED